MKKFFLILVVFLSIAMLTGCSMMMASKQPDQKNLSVLDSGTSRDFVLAELGNPISSGEDVIGSYDIFAFNVGYSKASKNARIFTHGVLSILSCGVWELVAMPIETAASGKEKKIKVYYDAEKKVFQVVNLEMPKPGKDKKKKEEKNS